MMKHKEIHLIIVASEAVSKKYNSYLSTRGVTFYTIRGKNQIENILEIIPINGILVDASSLDMNDTKEESFLSTMNGHYPMAYTTFEENLLKPEAKLNSPAGNSVDIDEFIFTYCAGLPRVMRTSPRKLLNLNIMLSTDASFTYDVEKTATFDVSDTGLFAITSTLRWEQGQRIYLVINELAQHSPIICTVIRVTAWGQKAASIPGISLRFDAILDSQQDELYRLIQP